MQRGLEAYEREFEKERFAVGGKRRTTKRAAAKPNPMTSTLSAGIAEQAHPITQGGRG